MKPDKWTDNAAVGVGLAAILAAFFGLVIRPGREAAVEYHRQIAAADHAIREVPARLAEVQWLQTQVARRRDYLQRTTVQFPAEPALESVVQQVAQLARECGLAVTRQEPLPSVRYVTLCKRPLRLSVSGFFESFARFLQGLEKLPRLIAIENVSLSSQDGGISGAVQGMLSISVYDQFAEDSDSADKGDS